MKTNPLFARMAACTFLFFTACSADPGVSGNTPLQEQPAVVAPGSTAVKKKIKIALLLDTSNSMDGLIDQAKSQLWKFVNALSEAKCGQEKPLLEIALYEYGNDRLPASEGYIRQVSLFTSDLDRISEELFSLRTNGGSEFCGQVIQTSLDQLDWKGDDGDLRIIFIAGNEPFSQGTVRYTAACANATEKDVVVNTIYCGSFDEGIAGEWKRGADLAKGNYMSIEQNRKTVYIESPYDKEITAFNGRLNATYIGYGHQGRLKKEKQLEQDVNAESYGAANATERIVSKSSGFYKNGSWDLVDASKEKSFDIEKVKEADLPQELRGKTTEEKRSYILRKEQERENIQKQIRELNSKRRQYIAEYEKRQPHTSGSLDAAMLSAIKTQASRKGFVFN